MCGIFVGQRGRYTGQMKHRGITTRKANVRGLELFHEHLPIQSTKLDDPIIRIAGKIVLFNGELFTDNQNDLDYIRDLFSFLDTDEVVHEIKNIDGFYSFIVLENDRIFAFTDPLGKKQLYFEQGVGIGSELSPFNKNVFDETTISNIQKFGYNHDNNTVYQNVQRIEPNRLYEFDYQLNLKSISNRFYQFKPKNGDLLEIMDLSVKNRLKGRHDVGLLLSGGLDSSIIYHHIDIPVQTYCVNNEDDLTFATMMDQNVKPVELIYNPKALKAMEMPIDLGSMYPQYDLFSKVNETVILTGDGADEIFGGYKRMLDYDSQYSDIFCELPYYHNIRIDRMSMTHTKECRSPFMALKVVEYGLSLPYPQRVNKQHLRDIYTSILPKEIVERSKEALKIKEVRSNPIEYRKGLINDFRSNR